MFLWRSSSKCKASGTRSSDWSSVAFKLFKLHLDRASGLVLTLVQCPDESYSGLVLTLLPDTRPNPKAYPKMWSAASCARRLLLSYHTPTYHTDAESRDDMICRPTAVAFFRGMTHERGWILLFHTVHTNSYRRTYGVLLSQRRTSFSVSRGVCI